MRRGACVRDFFCSFCPFDDKFVSQSWLIRLKVKVIIFGVKFEFLLLSNYLITIDVKYLLHVMMLILRYKISFVLLVQVQMNQKENGFTF